MMPVAAGILIIAKVALRHIRQLAELWLRRHPANLRSLAWRYFEMCIGHLPNLNQPRELADILLSLAAESACLVAV